MKWAPFLPSGCNYPWEDAGQGHWMWSGEERVRCLPNSTLQTLREDRIDPYST